MPLCSHPARSRPATHADSTVTDYLEIFKSGSSRQRAAYRVLRDTQLLETLAEFKPAIAGTLPLPIHTDASDLDILCEVHDADAFERTTSQFAGMPAFKIFHADVRGTPSTVVGWRDGDLDIELFAQPIAVTRQHGHRHLQIEARVLALAGPPAIAAITAMKQAGVKTEPAFARYLRLAGDDPYLDLLALEDLDDDALRRLLPALSPPG